MSKSTVVHMPRRRSPRPTMQSLHRRIDRLEERLEDLEDLRALEQAIIENGKKPMIPWEKAKKELGLD